MKPHNARVRRLVAFRDGDGRYTSAYAEPILASLMRPVHPGPLEAWWIIAPVERSDGLRFTVAQDLVRPVLPAELPPVTPEQRIAFAIILGRAVYNTVRFQEWAEDWLTARDRTPAGAFAAMGGGTAIPADDRAYVAHWATMAAAFPEEHSLSAQTAALVAAHVCPSGTFDFASRAEAALIMGA